MMVPHEYALNAVAVVQLPQIFDCAIHFGYLLAQDLRRRQQILFGQLSAKLLGNIGHFTKERFVLHETAFPPSRADLPSAPAVSGI